MKLDDKKMIIVIAVVFVAILLVLTFFSPSKQEYFNKGHNASFEKMSSYGSALQNRDVAVPFEEQYITPDAKTSDVPSIFETAYIKNCTPLGDISKLMQIETKYLLYYSDTPVYIHSTLLDVSSSGYVIKESVKTRKDDEIAEATFYSFYDGDGKCVQKRISIVGMEQYFKGDKGIIRCSGYPFWIVCREILDINSFERNDTVVIGGVSYKVRVFRSEKNEIWVGYDLPILFKYYFEDNTMNKSFSAELIDINYRGVR